jgi:hypothetical protein
MVKVVQTVLHEECEDEDEHTPEVQVMAAERPEDCVLCLLCSPDLNPTDPTTLFP